MKVYSIGRDTGCDIVINDNTNVVSRRHAILTVLPSGKMTIMDQSHNGTYVNGIRISPNVPVPVSRKDNISFAHVSRLDWNFVPNTFNAMLYTIIGIVAVLLIGGLGYLGYSLYASNNENDSSYGGGGSGSDTEVAADSTETKEHTDSVAEAAREASKKATGEKVAEKNDTVAQTFGQKAAKRNTASKKSKTEKKGTSNPTTVKEETPSTQPQQQEQTNSEKAKKTDNKKETKTDSEQNTDRNEY